MSPPTLIFSSFLTGGNILNLRVKNQEKHYMLLFRWTSFVCLFVCVWYKAQPDH